MLSRLQFSPAFATFAPMTENTRIDIYEAILDLRRRMAKLENGNIHECEQMLTGGV